MAASDNNQYLLSTVYLPGTELYTVHALSRVGVFTSILQMKKLKHREAQGHPVRFEPSQSDGIACLYNHYALLSSKHWV